MTGPVRAAVRGIFSAEDGSHVAACAELRPDGLVITAEEGRQIDLWRPMDLLRTMGVGGFQISARGRPGFFVFDPEAGRDLILALAKIPEATRPMGSGSLVQTMAMTIGISLVALVAFAWGSFWLIGWLFERASGAG